MGQLDQLGLHFGAVGLDGERRSIDARFTEFDIENPWVWHAFETLTFQLIRAGRTHFSADAILHRVRFDYALHTQSDDSFKINNDYTSRYARKWAAAHPEHAEFFTYRRIA